MYLAEVVQHKTPQGQADCVLAPAADALVRALAAAPLYGANPLRIEETAREDHDAQRALLVGAIASAVESSSGGPWGGLKPDAPLALVEFRMDMPGRAGKPVLKARCYCPYFGDVAGPEWVIAVQAMEQRLAAARASGLLAMGPNEAIAIVLGDECDARSQMVAAFMTDEHARVRAIDGVYPHGWQIQGPGVRFIRDLHRHATAEAERETLTELALETCGRYPASTRRVGLLQATLNALREHARTAPQERNANGALIERIASRCGSVAGMERAFGLSTDAGWRTYPTGDDAWYFGIFVNFAAMQTISYVEGDIVLAKCPDRESFDRELAEMAHFYGPKRKPSAVGISAAGRTPFWEGLFERITASFKEVVFADSTAPRDPPVLVRVKSSVAQHAGGEANYVPLCEWEIDLLDPRAFHAAALQVQKVDGGMELRLHLTGDQPETRTARIAPAPADTDQPRRA